MSHLTFMHFTIIRRCGLTQRYGGCGREDELIFLDNTSSCALMDWKEGLTLPVLALLLSLQVFDPSRFAPGSDSHSHAFLPFSGGSRWGILYLGGALHRGHTLMIVTCIYMWCLLLCPCILLCWEGGIFLYVQKKGGISGQGTNTWFADFLWKAIDCHCFCFVFCFFPTLDCVDSRTMVYKSHLIHRILPTVNVMVMWMLIWSPTFVGRLQK